MKTLDDFIKAWTQFKNQDLGKLLQPIQLIQPIQSTVSKSEAQTSTEPIATSDIAIGSVQAELEQMNDQELDNTFRKIVESVEGKPITEVNSIKYTTQRGSQSVPRILTNKQGIIKFQYVTDKNMIRNIKLHYIIDNLGHVKSMDIQIPRKIQFTPQYAKMEPILGYTMGSGLHKILSKKKSTLANITYH